MTEPIDFNQLLDGQIEGIEYGNIQLNLKIHRGALYKVDTAKSVLVKIEGNNPDADALGIIISAMKIQQKKIVGDGSLGFSILYRKSKPVQVQVQEFMPEQV
jgi:hypothetical protein